MEFVVHLKWSTQNLIFKSFLDRFWWNHLDFIETKYVDSFFSHLLTRKACLDIFFSQKNDSLSIYFVVRWIDLFLFLQHLTFHWTVPLWQLSCYVYADKYWCVRFSTKIFPLFQSDKQFERLFCFIGKFWFWKCKQMWKIHILNLIKAISFIYITSSWCHSQFARVRRKVSF